MKKQVTILSLGLALTGYNLGFSQQTKIQPCNTYAAMEEHFALHPEARTNYEASQKTLHQAYTDYTANKAANKTAAPVYTVPVVFHILHQGGPENISDAACIAALQQINNDYSRNNADTASIVTQFKSLYINSDIKFMLAKKDPSGNCITGIVRHVDPKTNWSQGSAGASSSYWPYTWNPTRYLNIYIVANIVPQGTVTGGGVIVGYTYRPGTWPTGNQHDAIVYRYDYLNGLDARSLSHEVGHWLNLAHTFGNTNNPGVACGSLSGGDGLNDTPDTKGNFASCPPSSPNPAYTCTSPDPSNSNLYYQNVQNIMDYSSCPKNFTTDQTNMMRSTLVGVTNGRNNLSTTSNLGVSFTDVDGAGLCAPVAEFLSTTNSYTTCVGGTITMKDFSYNGTISSWQWTAGTGAVIASPNATITGITFNTVGTVTVNLTVSNAQGSSSQVRTVTVINGAPGVSGPYMESFENAGVPTGWSMASIPAAIVTWQQTTNAALDAATSYYIDGPTTAGGRIGQLQMPIVDLLNNPGAVFTFAYAYARKAAGHNDSFKLQMSKDCGGNWTDVVTLNSLVMAMNSGGTTSTPYIPNSSSEWKIVTASDINSFPFWNTFASSPSVMIRFVFEEAPAGMGNNFYLDAVNFSVPTGVNELTKSIRLNLFPNPTTGEANLKFGLNDASTIKVSVVDLLGKEVLPAVVYNLPAGEQSLAINKEQSLAKGVYFVNISMNGAKMSRKLIIE